MQSLNNSTGASTSNAGTFDRSTDPMVSSSSAAASTAAATQAANGAASSAQQSYSNVHPFPSILRYMGTTSSDSPVGGNGRGATAVTVQNSASQTLSDLAQAASNQLMSENGGSGSGSGPGAADAMERDDPLLSDHPYGLPSYRTRMRRLMMAETRGERQGGGGDGADANAAGSGSGLR